MHIRHSPFGFLANRTGKPHALEDGRMRPLFNNSSICRCNSSRCVCDRGYALRFIGFASPVSISWTNSLSGGREGGRSIRKTSLCFSSSAFIRVSFFESFAGGGPFASGSLMMYRMLWVEGLRSARFAWCWVMRFKPSVPGARNLRLISMGKIV
ncbi:hypothetical protein I7I48_10067 [Histoplasma ohiense]|nr:hypothetical protein I7I48_10067 [Histoplasma ohiense (nom. inval.)]